MLEIIKFLKTEKGYKEYPQKNKNSLSFKTLLYKRVDSESVCEANDILYIQIHITRFESNDYSNEKYKVEIRANKNGKWWTLNCYSLTREEITSQISQIEVTLIRLFNSL